MADIGRKLDKGIEIFEHISNDTSELQSIPKGFEGLNSKFDSYIIEQKEHNQWMKGHLLKMDEHNKRMEERNKPWMSTTSALRKSCKKLLIDYRSSNYYNPTSTICVLYFVGHNGA